jgi:hypothetical protein
VRLNDSDARADILALDQRGVPDPQPRDIRDRILLAGGQGADGDAELACA